MQKNRGCLGYFPPLIRAKGISMAIAVINESPKEMRAFLKRFFLLERNPTIPNSIGITTKYTGKSHNLPVRPSSVGSGLLRLIVRMRTKTTKDTVIVVMFFMSVV
jgi:hypothetical protein